MIVIKVLNAEEVVSRERGRLLSKLAPLFVDVERRVEQEIVKQLQTVFEERRIQTDISIVEDNPPE